jgi:predicted phosphohydrolase
MKIQYASDLHLEFKQNKEFLKANPLQPVGDVLLLAGDTVPFALMDKHEDFFSYVSDHFQSTWWIPGNHEYYYSDIADRSGMLNENIRSNIHLVNNVTVQQDWGRLIFSTLWSKINPVSQWQAEAGISDFHVIKWNSQRFTTTRFNQLHADSLRFIESELKAGSTKKTMVITHHVPTLMNYPEEYKSSDLNGAFVCELSNIMEVFSPDYWIYGHHHRNTRDFEIGNTRLLTNQIGYVQYNEHLLFNSNKYIVV